MDNRFKIMKKLAFWLLVTAVYGLNFSCSQKEQTFPVAQIKTDLGEILFYFHEGTPRHKENFIKLTQAGYFDSLTFNRVIKNFVVQGGCPDTPEGFADSPYLLQPEFVDSLKHVYGAVGCGRDNNPDKISAGCQFYIVQKKEGLARLDGDYVIFGQVFKGMDVVDKIVSVPTDSTNTPIKPITLDVNIIQMSKVELKKSGVN
jgi:peptidyl-prolyl cis-trans isomerase B (cyclophilin B)